MKSFGHPLVDHSFEKLEPDYKIRFERMKVSDLGVREAKVQIEYLKDFKSAYDEVEKMSKVPWFWIGLTHMREAGTPPNFHAWLHNGDPMFDHNGFSVRTVHVPKGRPLNPNVDWEDGALDALEQMKLLNLGPWTPARCAWASERFNGFGYRDFHKVPSPYLWGLSSEQLPGKYTSDGHYDESQMDEQLGIMSAIKLILEEPSV